MLDWLDNGTHYWSVALVALGITGLLAIAPAITNVRAALMRSAFIVMLFVTLLAGRWPLVATSSSLEFDESGYVAIAMTAAVHPVPWKSFDAATVGPLNIYFLDLPKLFGIPVGYPSTHFMTIVLLGILLSGLYAFLRRFVDEAIARIAVLPALVFLTFTFSGEFEHYASELFPIMLVALALAAAAIPWTARRTAIVSAALTGLIIGALPFAKTQGAPLGAVIGIVFIALMPWRNREAARTAFFTFAGALFVVPVMFMGLVAANGAMGDFVASYVKMQVNYVAGASTPFAFIFGDPHFSEYVLVSVAMSLAAIALASALEKPLPVPLRTRWLPVGALALLAVSLLVLFVPHKPWTHYVFFLLPALSLLTGSTLGVLSARVDGHFRRAVVAIAAAALILIPMVRESRTATNPYVGHVVAIRALQPTLPVAIIRSLAHPGDRMALWGLDADLYPATGLQMGTRDSISYFQMSPNPLLSYFRARYVRDVIANKPQFFVDAVAPGAVDFTDRKTDGFETFPELAAVIRTNYHLACDIQGIRIYQRRGPGMTHADCPAPSKTMQLSARDVNRLRPIARPHALGFIDSLAGPALPGTSAVFPAHSKITASGWAIDPLTGKPGAALIFILDGKQRTAVTSVYGTLRPDVAIALNSERASYTGFLNAPVPTEALSAGSHTLQFGLVTADGKRFYLSANPVTFSIR